MRPSDHIRVLIADDELPARRGLRRLLEAHPDLDVVGEARSGREAVAAILTLEPSLVVLDVQMPEGSGVDVVREVMATAGRDRLPEVIFATAYDSYALQAFEVHAVDYLLKPYEPARLASALDRVRRHLHGAREPLAEAGLHSLLVQLEGQARQTGYLTRLAIRVGSRIRFVDVGDIDYFEADGNYVRIHVGARSELARETLAALAAQLDPQRFVRVHRSVIVNLRRIVEVEPLFAGEYVLFLAGGRRLTTGRTYRARVQQALGLRS